MRGKQIVTLSILIIAIISYTCAIKNPTEDFRLIANFSPVSTIVSVEVKNAATQDYIQNLTTLKIEGQDKALAVKLTGEAENTYTAQGGIFSFGITEDVEPSKAQPISITLLVFSDGYISTSKALRITTTGGELVTINMVERANPPSGVTNVETRQGAANSQGATTSSIQVQTPAETASQVSAQVNISENTVIKDASGTPLQGTLNTSVTFFNGQGENVLPSFPGGLTCQVNADENGAPNEGNFITAGFLAVDITDDNGRQAENFDQPVEFIMEIAEGMQNPETGMLVKLGDIVPAWSYNDETGEWKYEGKGAVEGPNENGKLFVRVAAIHLSYWNLDWFSNSCSYSRKIIFQNWLGAYGNIYLTFKGSGNASGWWHDAYIYNGDNWIELLNAPTFPVDIIAYAGNSAGIELGRWENVTLCGESELLLDVTIPAAILSHMGEKTFHITGICPNDKQLAVRPTAPIWYKRDDMSSWLYAGMVVDGVITVGGINFGDKYYLTTQYEGEWYEAAFEIGENLTNLVPEYADKITLDNVDGDHIFYTIILSEEVCDELNN